MTTTGVRRRLLVGLIASATCLGLTGCGDGSGSETEDGQIPSSVTVAFGYKTTTLDPNMAFGLPDVSAVHLIGGNLMRIDDEGKLLESLAEEGTEATDGLSWTFTLKPDLMFSDGSPLTADDVVANIERSKENENNGYGDFFTPITSVTANGDREVTFQLERRYPSLPWVLAEPVAAILKPESLKGDFTDPISAGPYALDSWGGSDTLTMKRNPNWAGGPEPEIETVIFETIPDFNERKAQVEGGDVDLAIDLPANQIPLLTDRAKPQITKMYGFHSLIGNNEDPILAEVGVRRAISKALDRERLARDVWYGETKPLNEFWPSTMTGHQGTYPIDQDLEAAKADLEGTACESGCTLELSYTPAYGWQPPAALLIQDDLKKIGIDVVLSSNDSTTYTDKDSRGDFQLELNGLYDYVNIPDGLMLYGLTSFNANSSRFASDELNAIASDVLASTPDDVEANLHRVNEFFVDQVPYVTLVDEIYVQATRQPEDVLKFGSMGVVNVAPGL